MIVCTTSLFFVHHPVTPQILRRCTAAHRCRADVRGRTGRPAAYRMGTDATTRREDFVQVRGSADARRGGDVDVGATDRRVGHRTAGAPAGTRTRWRLAALDPRG